MKNRIFSYALRNAMLPVFLCGLLASSCAFAQERRFPLPSTTGVVGKKDAGAAAEIKAHLQAVSAAGWQSLQATGTLTYPEGDTHAATLYLMGARYSRLDIEMGSGLRSLRVQGTDGRFQDERGNQGSLPPGTSSAGIMAFPRIWSVSATSSRISLSDQSSYSVSGQNLHRVTMEYPLESATGSKSLNGTAATDLYFDSNTHLLAHSVDAVTFSGPMRQTFNRASTYADYQQFSGVQVPTTIKQYLNGQLQWTLQLTQVTVNPALTTDTFSF
jgi:hypothetical protein